MPWPISAVRMTGASEFCGMALWAESRARTIITATRRMVVPQIWGTMASFHPAFANLFTIPERGRQARLRERCPRQCNRHFFRVLCATIDYFYQETGWLRTASTGKSYTRQNAGDDDCCRLTGNSEEILPACEA